MTPDKITALRQRADALARAPTRAAEVLALVAELKQADEFGAARLLLAAARERDLGTPQERVALAQAHALCTYKDQNLHAEQRHRDALAILEGIGLRDPACRDKETLGLGGAIYKRMWHATGLLEHLRTALAFYRAGWERDPEHDLGWCAANAAFLLDQFAFREQTAAARTGRPDSRSADYRAQADALRRDLLARLPALAQAQGKSEDYWVLATRAEACFGLEDFAGAADWLDRAARTAPDPWMEQSTAQQLARLARLHRIEPPAPGTPLAQWHPAWAALARLVGERAAAALESRRGKVGLALSGGGFRAALFHLGVMARLAECGVLRSVETLSTVSGGSILGAQYYLELRHLLQTRTDITGAAAPAIGDADYVALLLRVIADSVAGIENNLRIRALANLWANFRMLLSKAYSRSMRLGELYERYLFSRIRDDHAGAAMRRLRDLLVHPHNAHPAGAAAGEFRPSSGNWLRRAKVPNLMLNTTSLNTGHNWHFTARWMGEPPGLTGDEIDMNERYRRLYYEQAPTPGLQDYPLAYAVAASSCVPAMFEPLPLHDLYSQRTVRLVDGGVHDNQGMAALLDDDCELVLCSDASGQMDSQAAPADGMIGVFSRTSSILQDRVREAQYRDLRNRADSGALQGLFFVHLKQELDPPPVAFIGARDPAPPPPASTATGYGVDRELQRLLSEVRTDLDSFTEVECYALMASGYLMTRHQLQALDAAHRRSGLPGSWGGFEVEAPMASDASGRPLWPFAPLLPLMALPPDSADPRRRDLGVQLAASKVMFFRVWHLVPWLRTLGIAIGIVVVAALAAWIWRHWSTEVTFSWRLGSLVVAIVVAVAALFVPLVKFLQPRIATQTIVGAVVVAIVGWIASRVHLALFEPLLRRRGRLARLLTLK